MRELTVSFNNLLQDKRVRADQSRYESIQRQRASVISKYKRAYQEFLDLEAGLQSAKNWYSEMRETVESLEKNVETFVSNRRSEGAQLLNQIEQDRAASKSAQAALEQERLRGLMERMSMEPPPTSPQKQPGSARPTPTPLSFGASNMYPKQNFAGQYQLPSSPPPTQVNAPQSFSRASQGGFASMSYDPSSHGRIPGPASPPPNQTSFNMARGPASPPPNQATFNIGRGPTSPPPNQTSFGRPFSTYGNPAAAPVQSPQQQQPPQGYVPPGFVPPPPPPGPPPLGPQQTVHYNSNDYYAAGAGQRRGSAAQQHGSDPWAGLNAWK